MENTESMPINLHVKIDRAKVFVNTHTHTHIYIYILFANGQGAWSSILGRVMPNI